MMGTRTMEAARQLGVTHARLITLWKEGRVPRFEDKSWDVAACRKAFAESTTALRPSKIMAKSAAPEAVVPVEPKPDHPAREENLSPIGLPERDNELLEMRKAQLSITVKKGMLDLREREGELIEVEDVRRVWSNQISNAKSILLLLPAKLAPVLAGTVDALECQALLEDEIRRALSALAEYRPSAA